MEEPTHDGATGGLWATVLAAMTEGIDSFHKSDAGYWSAQEYLTVEMAFYGRLGGLMRQTVFQPNGQVPMASMLNTIRCISSKLFTGGLSYGTDDNSLRDAFSSFGEVVDGEFKSAENEFTDYHNAKHC